MGTPLRRGNAEKTPIDLSRSERRDALAILSLYLLKALCQGVWGRKKEYFSRNVFNHFVGYTLGTVVVIPPMLKFAYETTQSHMAGTDVELGVFDRKPGFGSEDGGRCQCSVALRDALRLDISQ
jgi:hypothetical protein